MSTPIYGTILNYRIGIATQNPKECLIQFAHIKSASLASQLFNRKVLWKQGDIRFLGTIRGPHGKNGVVKVKFQKNVPGQALGTPIELLDK
ncbi:50S ribosomal protein L35ae [Candidatus Bathyarchaeota archaeon]|nr:50S ribosomal protein L35ae [Candidatus Bathyarchaeota archaeon]